MDEFTTILCHARRFKSAVKELTVEQLEDVRSKLDKIIEVRALEYEKMHKKEAERLLKIKKYQEMLAADGIEPDELQAQPVKKKVKRTPLPPKYAIVNDAGERITWTGQGRMPNVFKSRIAQGENIEKYLI
ncbi:H-NS family nucleoid-associated regulatory protein [Desulforhopalus sp. IMCC35007]|uniref:H-NS histone family protein n=1 Tax=Desulforhopalus sp. IMCC35007 TaxID=2569543 RepID=UPI0010ADEF21|nr:H-NS family nucleoid-associated regulatory protein [Desulforhopalus sp. IMCC35007]TKB08158.1 H-NS histone family protein [Desulforhopalus sp. IMCC35007]